VSNSYFQFKNFTIHQDKCAMKVCTDACLFGAYIANYLSTQKINKALDIGTGTGLLSLMIAQKNIIQIDAVELNEEACLQAKENINNTLLRNSISIHHQNILEFEPNKKFDFIFSNPPFYENDLTSNQTNKNQAKHDESLTLIQLLITIKKLLNTNGEFAVLLPYHRNKEFVAFANNENFYLKEEILLKQTPSHNYFRSIQMYSLKEVKSVNKELTIKEKNNTYTPQFISLLKDYYLYL
jgi:tRNA1Val (adenine37-N6)-methyltransferase